MQRLTGLDATFLYMETPSSYMHVAGLAVFDPSTVPGGFSIEKVKALYADRLHLAAPFRRRLVEVPFGIHHPLWIEDPDFDLDWHIRHIAVPAPGGPRQLADLAAHLVSIKLDRSRPLWEMWVIEGLEQGNIAVLSKVHHAAIDGVAGNELTVALLDLTPEVQKMAPDEDPWKPDRIPTDLELLGYGLTSLARQPVRAVKTIRRTAGVALAHRSYAMASLSLPDVKMIKNAFGATVNDVVLALCAGALRRYFDGRGEQVDGPLVAMVPISVRAEDEKGAGGNRVSSMLVSLATDIDDPVDRLRAISDGTKDAKEQSKAIGADTLTDWAEFAAPAVAGLAARLYSRTK